MGRTRVGMVALLLASMLGMGCATVVRRTGDEIRRQQSGSEPYATAVRSRGSKPWQAIVHTAAHDAALGLVDGALDAAEQPQHGTRLQALGKRLDDRVGTVARIAGEQLVAGVNAELPATRAVVVELLDGVRDELRIDPEMTGHKLGRGLATGMGQGIESLGPAIDELELPRLAEDVGRRAALGLSAGMAESLADQGPLAQVIDARLARGKETVDHWLARGLLIALVLAVTVLVVVASWWFKERGRRVEAERARLAAAAEGERREQMLRLVAGAIKQAGTRDQLSAFREEIKRMTERAEERETAAALNYFLTREGLKLDRPTASLA